MLLLCQSYVHGLPANSREDGMCMDQGSLFCLLAVSTITHSLGRRCPNGRFFTGGSSNTDMKLAMKWPTVQTNSRPCRINLLSMDFQVPPSFSRPNSAWTHRTTSVFCPTHAFCKLICRLNPHPLTIMAADLEGLEKLQ